MENSNRPAKKESSGKDVVVPVQLTTITPVRVFNVRGEYFDTEMELDAPMRVLQVAIEDYFKVNPEVQLLMHNRQQVDTTRTLRQNGCLMLKGDPYIKIVFSIKRGSVLNLVCHVSSTHAVVALACSEECTVWEVKELLCHELARRAKSEGSSRSNSGAALTNPHRLRLMWRYMELNDKATLHYYRVPTNSEFYVMLKKGPVPPHGGGGASATARKMFEEMKREQFNNAVRIGIHRPPHEQVQAADASVTPLVYDPRSYAALNSGEAVQQQQQPPPPRVVQQYVPVGSSQSLRHTTTTTTLPLPPSFTHQRVGHAVVPLPESNPPQQQPGASSPEVAVLQQAVRSLEGEVAAMKRMHQQSEQQQMAAAMAGATQSSQVVATSLQSAAAMQRIQELENSIERLHHYLERAISLIPSG